MTRFVIENERRPGYYWNPKLKSFWSHLSGNYKCYTTYQRALRGAGATRGYYKIQIKAYRP